jgi:MYXO-CTERM domain-containing protein
LFPYGPAAGIGGDGTNEIDIEFSRWGQANGVNADFTDYPSSGNTIGETTFKFSLDGGTSSTARMVWAHDSIESTVLKGHQPLSSETGLIKKWKYAPPDSSTNIPQQAMPLGINLWCFDAIPTDGKNVEIVLRDFQFIKEGDPLPGTGGMGGTGSGGSASGGSANGGSASGGKSSAGGASNGGGGGSSNPAGGSGGSSNAAGGSNAAGNVGSGGMLGAGAGSVPVSGGNANGGASAGASSGGAPSGSGGTSSSAAGTAASRSGQSSTTPVDGSDDASGCSCQVAGDQRQSAGLILLVGLTLLRLRRRERSA